MQPKCSPRSSHSRRRCVDIIASRSASQEQWDELMRILREHRSIDYAYKRAVEYGERAKKLLYAFPASAERDALLALPEIGRAHV